MLSAAAPARNLPVNLRAVLLVISAIFANFPFQACAQQSEVGKAAERIAETGRTNVIVADFIEARLLKHSLVSTSDGSFLTAGLARSHNNTAAPQCIDCPPPRYTRAETVVLMVTVNTDGRAVDPELVKTSDPRAVKAAIEAVKKWRFLPARGPNGQPIAMRTEIEVHTTDRW